MITTHDILKYMKENKGKEYTSLQVSKKFNIDVKNVAQKLGRLSAQGWIVKKEATVDKHRKCLYKYK